MHQLGTLPVTTEIPSMTWQPRLGWLPARGKCLQTSNTLQGIRAVFTDRPDSTPRAFLTHHHIVHPARQQHVHAQLRNTKAHLLQVCLFWIMLNMSLLGNVHSAPQSWINKISSTTVDGAEATSSCDQTHSFCIIQSRKLQRASKTHVHSPIHHLLQDLMSKYKLCSDS